VAVRLRIFFCGSSSVALLLQLFFYSSSGNCSCKYLLNGSWYCCRDLLIAAVVATAVAIAVATVSLTVVAIAVVKYAPSAIATAAAIANAINIANAVATANQGIVVVLVLATVEPMLIQTNLAMDKR